jgi:hypothetical protein
MSILAESLSTPFEPTLELRRNFIWTAPPCIDFIGDRFAGFAPDDFLYTAQNHTVTGTLAIWDQRKTRQLRISEYPPLLEAFRKASGDRLGLPVPGQNLALAHAAFISTSSDNHFEHLLVQACRELSARGLSGLLLSLHERDSRNAVMSRFVSGSSSLRLFAVCFDKPPAFDNRVPFFDVAFI